MTNGWAGWTGVPNAAFLAQLGQSRSFATGVLISLLAGCGGQLDHPDSREELGRFTQAISSEEDASILGFEDPSQWTPTGGSVGAATIHQSGEGALAVKGGGYREIVSDPLSTLDLFDNTLTVSFRLPSQQPNQYWYGQLQLIVDLPSQGLYNHWVGAIELTGRPLQTFLPLTFTLPQTVVTKLGADYADLRFKFALNVPNNATGTYILDSLRFENSNSPPSILLGTSGDQSLQPDLDSLSVFGDSLPLIGRIVDAVGVASASVRINGGSPIAPALDANGNFALTLPLDSDPDLLSTSNLLEVSATDVDGNTVTETVTVTSIAPRYPGELIVLFANTASAAQQADALTAVGASERTRITERMLLVNVPPGNELAALDALLAAPAVRAALPNYPLIPARTTNDRDFSSYWHLPRIGATTAWDTVFGSDDIIVGVIDSGMAYDTPMFRGQPCTVVNGIETWDNNVPPLDNVWKNDAECCLSPPCTGACHPSEPQNSADTCPLSDLNGDGCPGVCGTDDDGDGEADFADPDVRVLYSNGRDDDGDNLIDEQGPGGTPCSSVTAAQMQGAAADQDCDGAARDDDENGYPDDCRGFQFARFQGPLLDRYEAAIAPNDPQDLYGGHPMPNVTSIGHGTQAAQYLGELGDNCVGGAGVAPRVKMIPLPVGRYTFNEMGERTDEPTPDLFAMIEAYRYAAKKGALITNASVSAPPCNCGPQPLDTCAPTCPWGTALSLQSARDQVALFMGETESDHVLHVHAAGNLGLDIDVTDFASFPDSASLSNVLRVGASDFNDDPASFTNYGVARVSLAAPGDGLPFFGGTSAASPMVAGAAVLLLEAKPELRGDPRRAIQLLEETVTPVASWSGLSRSGGIVNIANAIGAAAPPQYPFKDLSHELLPPSGRDLPTNDVDLLDVDGDGDLDILEFPCDAEGATGVPQLLKNDGTGHFTKDASGWPAHAVSHCDADFGDVDGDGDLDVVAGGMNTADPDSATNQNELYLNNAGSFQLATSGRLPAETDPTRVATLCDVDSDGDLDMFAANFVPNTDPRVNYLYVNDGTGSFTDETNARLTGIGDTTLGAPTKALCAELTQAPSSLCAPGDTVCQACADPTLSAQGLVASGKAPDLTACLAIRANVAPEIVVSGSQGTITRLFRNQGAGVFIEANADLNLPLVMGARQEQDVDGADMDGDGDIDLMFATTLGARNLLMLNDGSGVFSEAPSQGLNQVGDWCRETELGDFTGDGLVDVLLLRGDPNQDIGGSPTIYVNVGGGMFGEWNAGLDTSYRITTDGDIGDVNGDGWLDILVGNDGTLNQLYLRTP